jgi:hypothetical protein
MPAAVSASPVRSSGPASSSACAAASSVRPPVVAVARTVAPLPAVTAVAPCSPAARGQPCLRSQSARPILPRLLSAREEIHPPNRYPSDRVGETADRSCPCRQASRLLRSVAGSPRLFRLAAHRNSAAQVRRYPKRFSHPPEPSGVCLPVFSLASGTAAGQLRWSAGRQRRCPRLFRGCARPFQVLRTSAPAGARPHGRAGAVIPFPSAVLMNNQAEWPRRRVAVLMLLPLPTREATAPLLDS